MPSPTSKVFAAIFAILVLVVGSSFAPQNVTAFEGPSCDAYGESYCCACLYGDDPSIVDCRQFHANGGYMGCTTEYCDPSKCGES